MGDTKMTEQPAVPSLTSLFKKKNKKGAKAINLNTDAKTLKQKEAEAAIMRKEKENEMKERESKKEWQDDKIETKQLKVGAELGQIEKEEQEEQGPTTMGWNKTAMKEEAANTKVGSRQFPKLSGESRMVVLHGEKAEGKIKQTKNRFSNLGESDDEDAGPAMTRKKKGEMIENKSASPEEEVTLNPKQQKEANKRAAEAKEKKDEADQKKDAARMRMEEAEKKAAEEAAKPEAVVEAPKIKADMNLVNAKYERTDTYERRKLVPVDLPDSEMY